MDNNILVERLNRYIAEHELIGRHDRLLLTVSGGVDSMVMLHLLASLGYDIGVAHCNFGLRGEEADEDEKWVEAEAARFGIPYYNKRFDTRGEMERTGESVQMAARRLRYEWFNQLCAEHGYDSIAIAHQADDSIETFFINLLRGTGLKGLTGISKVNGRIIRPLLFASRKEILDYAHANGIIFREDSSNRSTKYLRNKIRLGIIPRLREISPKFTESTVSAIGRLADAQLFITRAVELIADQVVDHNGGEDIINPDRIDPKYPLDFVIYELLSATYGFKGDTIDALCASLRRGATGKRFYSANFVAYIDRGRVVVTKIQDNDDCRVEMPRTASKVYCGNSVLYIEPCSIDDIDTYNQPDNVALIDADTLSTDLYLRRWQPGDSFIPLGMEGHKKVSDYLIDCKVSMAEKERQFVLMSGSEVVWLVGRRLDERYKLTSKTENVLKLTREII